jgi:hypothetical protein
MSTIEEYAAQPRLARLRRLVLTRGEIAAVVEGADADLLARRPAIDAWAPVEIICHLRDSEEWFLVRVRMILLMDEPRFPRSNPDRWARERQYLRHDAAAAVSAFRRWRDETRAQFDELSDDAWGRGGVHGDSRGRRTIDQFLSVMAWHDENHLDQLRRALDGRP